MTGQIIGALLCWAGLHHLRYEMTRVGERVTCRRCQVTRSLRGVNVR
jgi:hypothetical protein